MEVTPTGKPGHRTVMRYLEMQFNANVPESTFSLQRLETEPVRESGMRSSTLRLAWRNLGRNRKRTGLALAAIGLGQFALLTMSGSPGLHRCDARDSHRSDGGPCADPRARVAR